MAKRFVWLGTGYVAGAASSWLVTRKVRTVTDKFVPAAVRGEAIERVAKATQSAKTIATTANDRVSGVKDGVKDKVRSESETSVVSTVQPTHPIDLRDGASTTPSLDDVRRQLDVGRITDSPAVARLRERSSRYGRE